MQKKNDGVAVNTFTIAPHAAFQSLKIEDVFIFPLCCILRTIEYNGDDLFVTLFQVLQNEMFCYDMRLSFVLLSMSN